MLEFAWPLVFAALPLPLLAWWLLPAYRERRASVQVPFFDQLAAAIGQTPQRGAVVMRRLPVQIIVAAIVWVLLVAALARPQWVGEPITRDVSARDLMLAVDLSGSMEQADFRAPDGQMLQRLAGVKQVVNAFVARRHGDRIGLILFGTKAYVQVPFTQDLATVQLLLDQTRVAMAGEQTAIGDAIGLAIKAFEQSKAEQKVLILLTDGNDTASRVPPAHAADIAQLRGLVIYTIGIGDPHATGENRVDLDALKAVAATTKGQFFRAEDAAQLEAIYADIDKLAPVKLQTQSWRPRLPLFQWPLGAAVVLALGLWALLLLRDVVLRWRHTSHDQTVIPSVARDLSGMESPLAQDPSRRSG
jgi:Ca-activated chloride channel family protein